MCAGRAGFCSRAIILLPFRCSIPFRPGARCPACARRSCRPNACSKAEANVRQKSFWSRRISSRRNAAACVSMPRATRWRLSGCRNPRIFRSTSASPSAPRAAPTARLSASRLSASARSCRRILRRCTGKSNTRESCCARPGITSARYTWAAARRRRFPARRCRRFWQRSTRALTFRAAWNLPSRADDRTRWTAKSCRSLKMAARRAFPLTPRRWQTTCWKMWGGSTRARRL